MKKFTILPLDLIARENTQVQLVPDQTGIQMAGNRTPLDIFGSTMVTTLVECTPGIC